MKWRFSKKLKGFINRLTKRYHRSTRKRSGQNLGKILFVLGTLATGIVIGGVAPPVASLIANSVGISEPHLVRLGGVPAPPVLDVKSVAGSIHILHITIKPVFKNLGFKSGHVDKVIVAPDGLHSAPEVIDPIYLDRSEIGWLEEKEIRCEFLVKIRPVKPSTTMSFRVYFYGPKGNELYWEKIEVEGRRQRG